MSVKLPDAIIIEGHVQGLSNLRSLGEKGVKCWVIDRQKCISKYSKYCNKFIICPSFNSKDFIDFLVELGENYQLNKCVLLPSNDHAVLSIYENYDRLKKYYLFPKNESKTLSTIYDKFELGNISNQLGVPSPKTSNFIDIKTLTFPILVKGKRGLDFYKKFGKKVILLNSIEEFTEFKNKFDISQENIFFQELINTEGISNTISFACYCENGVIEYYWCGEKLAEHPYRFGTATVAQSIQVQELEELSKKLISELSYSGICEIEYLFDDRTGTYHLIEINARTWLWVELAKRCGVDLTSILYFRLKNMDYDAPRTAHNKLIWYNPLTFFVYTLCGVFIGKSSWSVLKIWFKTKKVNALIYKNDFMPFIAYLFLMISILKKR